MTWYIDTDTGDLIDPNGKTVDNLGAGPYRIPDDAQAWGETQFRAMTMSELTTDQLADFAQLWAGDVELRRE
jgi:hypothetical protein